MTLHQITRLILRTLIAFSILAIVAASNWGLGRVTKKSWGISNRRPSVSKKKNGLSLLIGPPIVALVSHRRRNGTLVFNTFGVSKR